MRYFFFLFFMTFSWAQNNYPQDYFGLPITNPIQLSGNFGELRPNHFHAGFDLKTLSKEGVPILAAADGYVARIKVATVGNGTAIYINHPNGYTTVYCHLQKANGAIETYIKKTHYAEKSFFIEMFPKKNELTVKKGDTIAFSGNTGSSEGPHLHFEFRDTASENIINPLLFGYDKLIKDTKKPIISGVYVYPLQGSTANLSKQAFLLPLILQKDGSYLASKVVADGKIGFGISAADYDDVSFNKNGVYKMQTFVDGKPSFGYQMDTYSFEDMRYINALIDYNRYKKTSVRVQKLFMESPINLSLLKTDENFGVVQPTPNLTTQYQIEVSDYFGNTTKVVIPVMFSATTAVVSSEITNYPYFVKAKRDTFFEKDDCSVFFPAGVFYQDFKMNFAVKNQAVFAHEDVVPVHSNFTVSIKDAKFAEYQYDKLYIALVAKNGKTSYNATSRKENIFTTRVKTLGTYALVLDTVAPTISIAKPIESKWLTTQKKLQLSINDSGSGIKSFKGFLNDTWILFTYDHKTRKITHEFSDGIVAEGENILRVEVTDNCNNTSTFTSKFYRSQK